MAVSICGMSCDESAWKEELPSSLELSVSDDPMSSAAERDLELSEYTYEELLADAPPVDQVDIITEAELNQLYQEHGLRGPKGEPLTTSVVRAEAAKLEASQPLVSRSASRPAFCSSIGRLRLAIDVNGDNRANSQDLICMARYIRQHKKTRYSDVVCNPFPLSNSCGAPRFRIYSFALISQIANGYYYQGDCVDYVDINIAQKVILGYCDIL